jgi:hypothetical protein
MNNKRILERIAKIGLVALLVGYGIYQTAYGMEMVVPSNGTVTFKGNGTYAEFSAPPGSIIKNPSIESEQGPPPPPVTINFTDDFTGSTPCVNCAVIVTHIFDPSSRLQYKGYVYWLDQGIGQHAEMIICGHERDVDYPLLTQQTLKHHIPDCVYLPGQRTNSSNFMEIDNTAWTMVNSTSDSNGTIYFGKAKPHSAMLSWITYHRYLNGKTHVGSTIASVTLGTLLELCDKVGKVYPECAYLKSTVVSPNHLEFKDQHGGTIDLRRNG